MIKKIFLFFIIIININCNEKNDIYTGKKNYYKYLCHICHGNDGKKTTLKNYPKIAGQNKLYNFNQIKNIRDGQRINGISSMMKPYVEKISDKEILEISTFLEQIN